MNKVKIQELLDCEGLESVDEFLEEFGYEGVVPGICMNDDCDFVGYYEPDQTRGWCEVCHSQTVMSGLILMGVM